MIIIEDKIQNIKISQDLCIALGTFDGVHRGHQKLINETVLISKLKGIKNAVLTFNKHPLHVLMPELNLKIITDNNTKAKIFESLGIDYVFFIDFNNDFANIEPVAFIDYLSHSFNAKAIVCGYNYTFGKLGIGNTKLLSKYKNIFGYDLKIIDKVTYNNLNISSSTIRKKVEEGKIEEANLLLGYNLFFSGEVISGKQIGNKLGFPTANLNIPANLCLRNGVYITKTKINEKIYPSISNVGFAPTLNCNERILETHIIDFNENIYNSIIKIEFLSFIRDEKKFSSIFELRKRICEDILFAKNYFKINNCCLQ